MAKNSLAEWDAKYLGAKQTTQSSQSNSEGNGGSSNKSLEEWDRQYLSQRQTSKPTTRTLPITTSATKSEAKLEAKTDTKPTTKKQPGAINALGAGSYGSDKNDRAAKVIKGGAQQTAAQLTNLWGWLKASDAAARARDEADSAYIKETDKAIERNKEPKIKSAEEQSKALNENLAKQKDTWSKNYAKADELLGKSEETIAEAKDGLGKVGQALVDIGVAGTQLAGDAVANLVAPGAGMAVMIARTMGGGAQEARLSGKDIGAQNKSAVKTAAIAWLTEKMFGAFGKLYGGGAADDIVEAVVKKVGKTNKGRSFLRWVLNAAGEGVEEITEDLLNAGADKVLKLGDGKLNLGDVLYDGLIGFALGGVGSVSQIVNGNYRTKNEAIEMVGAQKALAEAVVESAPQDSEVAKVAQEMVQKIDNGEILSADEVQTLATVLEETSAEQTEVETPKKLTPLDAVVKAAQNGSEQLEGSGNINTQPNAENGLENENSKSFIGEEQINIDNTANSAYNPKENGGVPDGLHRTVGEGVPARDGYNQPNESGRENGRRNLQLVGDGLTDSAKASIKQRGIEPVDITMSTDNAAFSFALNSAKESNPANGWAVWGQTADDLNGKTVYISDNGAAGFAIAGDDIEAVFSNKKAGAPKSTLASLMPQAIAAGGRKLDCFGEVLVNGYSKYGGMRPVARVEFNDKHAPDGWTPDKGRPYIYFMVATDTDPNTVVAKQGTYPIYSQAELDSLKTFTTAEYGDDAYDAADAYRNEMLSQNELPQGTGAASAEFLGEMTPAEQWVAEAQGKGDSALHPVSDAQVSGLISQQHRAPQEVPKVDPNGKLTRKGVSTIINSTGTNAEMNELLLNKAYEGAFSYEKVTDKKALRKAQKEVENDDKAALNKFLDETKNGKVSKENTVRGIALYYKYVGEGDYSTAIDIAIALANDGTSSAQALQARKLLAKLTPAGKLFTLTKTVKRMSDVRRKRVGEKKLRATAEEIEVATDEAVEEAAEQFAQKSKGNTKTDVNETAANEAAVGTSAQPANQIGKGKKKRERERASGSNQVGDPFAFEYADEVGKAVAETLVKSTENRLPKPNRFMKTIIGNLTSFAKQLTPKAMSKPNMSAVERIADYMANKEFYDNAWASAQDYIRAEYADNEQVLYALDEFTKSLTTMTAPVGTQTMLKALAESAMATFESNKTIAIQNALNIKGAAQRIADSLVKEVERINGMPLDEETRTVIEMAAEDYVSEVVADTDPTKLARSQIRDVMSTIGETVSEVAKRTNTNKTAVAMEVTDMLTTRWGLSAEDAANIAEVVQEQFTDMVSAAMESKLNQIYGKKKAPQIRTMTDLFVESVNLGAFNSEEFAAKAAEKFFGVDIAIDNELAQEYVEALEDGNKEDIDSTYQALVDSIAEQLPADWKEKFNAWRYFAMLANVPTHLRNIGGTGLFAPIREIKNVTAIPLEAVGEKLSNGKFERTKTFLNPIKDKALISACLEDYTEVKEDILSGGKYKEDAKQDSFERDIQNARTIFSFAPIEKARRGVSYALDAEDSWFSKPAYAAALARYLKVNGISAAEWINGAVTDEQKARARSVAIKEAQKATYRDCSAFADIVSKIRVKLAEESDATKVKLVRGAANAVVEGLLPFKKTPANVVARAVEYSPIGLITSLTSGSVDVANGKITPSEWIDDISSGLSGSAIIAFGAFMARLGILGIRGGGDDNDELDKLDGYQDYSITIGDKSVSLSWASPSALPVLVGVELYNNLIDKTDSEGDFWGLIKSLANISDPVFESTMLSGVNDLVKSVKNSDNPALAGVAQLAANYLTQVFPTIFGGIERTTEDVRQSTFISKASGVPNSVQRTLGKIFNKLPGEYNQIPYIDAWGRTEESGNFGKRFFDNLVNPAYVNDIKTEDVESELRRLAENGFDGLAPKMADMNTQINGEYLTADEYVKYAQTRGQTSLTELNKLVSSSAYSRMSDADKAKAISDVYSYAKGVAALEVNPKAEVSSWITEAKQSGNPAKYITDKAMMRGAGNAVEKASRLVENGYSGKQLVEKAEEYGLDKKFTDYIVKTQQAKISDKVAISAYEKYNSTHNIEGGKTRKEQMHDYINSLPLSASEKSALYYSFYKK